jgi:uncharacterized protein YkwD
MKKLIIIILAVVIIITGFIIRDQLSNNLENIQKGVVDLLKESEKKIFLSSPLVSKQDSSNSFLDKNEVIRITNLEREKYNLAPLKESAKLNLSAKFKAEDLFKNQYFEHQSPTGIGVSDLATQAGYDFIVLGENLAMGNFEDDQALVQAWMDSPGHRANILNSSFSEIGVSVIKGIFNGKETWMAVQHFALPLSVCPKIDESLKAQIEANELEIVNIQQTLETMQSNPRSRENVKEYNALVSKHNSLVEQDKILIEEYNNQINAFNQCLNNAVQ